jgi:uncharacterized membrane protein (DUF441 family)
MDELTSAALILSPVTVGIVEVAKRAGLPVRWAPVFALIAGVVLALLAAWGNVLGGYEGNWARVALGGLLAGLAASGLYSGVKTTARG